ncbi:MAG: hypothetical protein ACI4GY_00520 [Acutalibacteraceae bacterium]
MKKYPFVIIMVIILFAAVLLFVLRGEIKPVDDLMHPPSDSDSQSSIKLALEKEIGKSVVLRSVRNDENNNSLFYEDIDVGNKDETLVFFSAGKSFDAVSFAVFEKKVSGFSPIAVVNTNYRDVERVDFADINGDGKNEIIVGLSSYNDSITRRLLIYSIKKKDRRSYVEKIYECPYSAYDIFDADTNGTDDVFLISTTSSSTLYENNAYVIYYSKNALVTSEPIKLDASINTVARVSSDYKKSEKTSRFFIDGYTSDGHMATDVITCTHGSHQLKRYASFSAVNISKRDVSIYCTDVDSDGLLDIPCMYKNSQSENKSIDSVHFILWTDVSSDGTEPVGKMLENKSKGFYLLLDEKIVKNCNIKTDDNGSIISFYSKDDEKEQLLFSIASSDNAKSADAPQNYSLLTSEREYDYYYVISESGKKSGISKSDILKLMAFELEGSFS